MNSVRLLLLDRDGTINRSAQRGRYVTDPAEVELLNGVGPAIARFNRAGIPVVVATNQQGVATGKMTMRDVQAVNETIAQLLLQHGAHIDQFLICPHREGTCDCRKPQPGLLITAMQEYGVDREGAVFVGDADSDREAASAAGIRGIQVSEAGPLTTATVLDGLPIICSSS